MTSAVRPAMVLFVADLPGMLAFYRGLGDYAVQLDDPGIAILDVGGAELILHPLRDEPPPPRAADGNALRRSDSYCKPCLPVGNIDRARKAAGKLGGWLDAANSEWSWRGVRACDGVDPEGNVFQLRTLAAEP